MVVHGETNIFCGGPRYKKFENHCATACTAQPAPLLKSKKITRLKCIGLIGLLNYLNIKIYIIDIL